MRRGLLNTLYFFLFSSSLVVGCAAVPESPPSLNERAPRVLYVIPSEAEPLPLSGRFWVVTTSRLDAETVNSESIWLVRGEPDPALRPSELYKALQAGDLTSVPISHAVEGVEPHHGEGEVLVLTPEEPLEPGVTYSLLMTSKILSVDRIPLVVEKGDYFCRVYRTVDTVPPDAELAPPGLQEPFEQSDRVDPVLPEPDHVPSPEEDPASPVSADSVTSTSVVINEIYYDAPESDTDGLLFVELYGTRGLSLAGYKINFVNGDDGKITDSITLPEGAVLQDDGFFVIADARTSQPNITQVPGADLIDNFDPQNGPDAVQLVDSQGQLIDAVGYGEGIVATAENNLATLEDRAAPDVSGGHSIGRRAPGGDTGDNSIDFEDQTVPTPGGS